MASQGVQQMHESAATHRLVVRLRRPSTAAPPQDTETCIMGNRLLTARWRTAHLRSDPLASLGVDPFLFDYLATIASSAQGEATIVAEETTKNRETGRLIKKRIERRGKQIVHCLTFTATRAEIENWYRENSGHVLRPDQQEAELTFEIG
jgi:hypothetical protein